MRTAGSELQSEALRRHEQPIGVRVCSTACYLVDCGSKSGEWGTGRRNCRRGREWCCPDRGPRGSVGRRTRELTARTLPAVGRWGGEKRGTLNGRSSIAAAAAARGPGAVGSFGGGEGDAGQTVRRAPGKGHVPEQRQQVQGPPPQPPPRPLPRKNGCGAGRAAKFASAPRGAGCFGEPAPNSAARPPGWSPLQDLERLGGRSFSALYKKLRRARGGGGGCRCAAPLPSHTLSGPPPLLLSAPPGLLPLRGSPLALAPPAEGRGPCPFG